MSRTNYNTNQKEMITKKIKSFNGDWTIKELYEALNSKVGLTTIYRLVDKLIVDGEISKINDSSYCYLGNCREVDHFYLKCDTCGKLEHIDCSCIKKLTNHILKEHDFTTNKEHIILNGICSNCQEVK